MLWFLCRGFQTEAFNMHLYFAVGYIAVILFTAYNFTHAALAVVGG